ncbi:MAG: hypothetical protein ACK42L_05220 [Thermoanaerobaculum sp.]
MELRWRSLLAWAARYLSGNLSQEVQRVPRALVGSARKARKVIAHAMLMMVLWVLGAVAQEPPGKVTHWVFPPSSLWQACPLEYDYCAYEEGCVDALNGSPVPCTGEELLYQPEDLANTPAYNGGHLHPRNTVESLGGLWAIDLPRGQWVTRMGPTLYQDNPPAWFRIPAASGVVRFWRKATFGGNYRCAENQWAYVPDPDKPEVCLGTFEFHVLIPDLVELPSSHEWAKVREKGTPHEFAFFGLPTMVDRLIALARWFRDEYLKQCPTCVHDGSCLKLSFNDMSLLSGGLFDLEANWGCSPHKRHRLGRSADLNHCLPKDAGGCGALLGKDGGQWGIETEDQLDDQAMMLGLKRLEKKEGRIHYELLDARGRMFP